jgi:predicted phosphodiesterase
VVIGDTGCRVLHNDIQSCDDNHWPLKRIADLAAQKKPDLVIHVGDYLYRETCPGDGAYCPKFNVGNRWEAWNDDFFTPTRALLAAAPWVFVRGNHEACNRPGAEGWIRFLSADNKNTPNCRSAGPEPIAPYLLSFGDLNVIVADSSAGSNKSPLSAQANELAHLGAASHGATTWLATHKPFLTLEALRSALPDASGIDLILSGHIHDFAAYVISSSSTPQLIVGNSGTKLDVGVLNLDSLTAAGVVQEFGYVLITRHDNESTVTLFGLSDDILASCALRGIETRCLSRNN